ncbi:hypothetical protein RFI_18357 [Reticulomyxa filosa]|uniref:Uncharacterized protein n=1 Tax=Reticulomyxa filosa TaxID=46433 RepID=X6MYM0_RETFI|nr:hypothetical protein RFI_18357 [Reticulomyxa filosa]|eukprot:ETO18886.1 hypothetical protein RFI_18357 [Reticulomyxa filosa]
MTESELNENEIFSEASEQHFNSTTEKKLGHAWAPPRVFRGHPRWAPTNDVEDVNCVYFLVGTSYRAATKVRYNWLTDRTKIDNFVDNQNLQKEKEFSGSFLDCIRLKYLMNENVAIQTLVNRFGINEPYATQEYEKNHIYTFREKPPLYFQQKNGEIPQWRYNEMKYQSNIGLSQLSNEHFLYLRKKWGKYYKMYVFRSKMKAFLIKKYHKYQPNNETKM